MDYLRNYVSGHFKPKLRIPDSIYLLEGLKRHKTEFPLVEVPQSYGLWDLKIVHKPPMIKFWESLNGQNF